MWTIAQHSIAVARTIHKLTGSRTKAAAGLLHDAHEAVIGDITTPVARFIDHERISELKGDVQAAIHVVLGIPFSLLPDRHPEVALADAAALTVERMLFMRPTPRPWTYREPDPEWCRVMHNEVRSVMEWGPDYTQTAMFCEEYARLVVPEFA